MDPRLIFSFKTLFYFLIYVYVPVCGYVHKGAGDCGG